MSGSGLAYQGEVSHSLDRTTVVVAYLQCASCIPARLVTPIMILAHTRFGRRKRVELANNALIISICNSSAQTLSCGLPLLSKLREQCPARCLYHPHLLMTPLNSSRCASIHVIHELDRDGKVRAGLSTITPFGSNCFQFGTENET